MATENPAAELPDDFYETIHERLNRRVYEQLRDAVEVVDIACGDCSLARYLVETGPQLRVIGVDTATTKLAAAEQAVHVQGEDNAAPDHIGLR